MTSADEVVVEKVEIKKEKIDAVGEDKSVELKVRVGSSDEDHMNESVYSDVVSHTRKLISVGKDKKCIQVFVSNDFCHMNEEKAVVYAAMINCYDFIW